MFYNRYLVCLQYSVCFVNSKNIKIFVYKTEMKGKCESKQKVMTKGGSRESVEDGKQERGTERECVERLEKRVSARLDIP